MLLGHASRTPSAPSYTVTTPLMRRGLESCGFVRPHCRGYLGHPLWVFSTWYIIEKTLSQASKTLWFGALVAWACSRYIVLAEIGRSR